MDKHRERERERKRERERDRKRETGKKKERERERERARERHRQTGTHTHIYRHTRTYIYIYIYPSGLLLTHPAGLSIGTCAGLVLPGGTLSAFSPLRAFGERLFEDSHIIFYIISVLYCPILYDTISYCILYIYIRTIHLFYCAFLSHIRFRLWPAGTFKFLVTITLRGPV